MELNLRRLFLGVLIIVQVFDSGFAQGKQTLLMFNAISFSTLQRIDTSVLSLCLCTIDVYTYFQFNPLKMFNYWMLHTNSEDSGK